MIRTKAKGLLLSIMLIIACSCFFACKESKVKVGSIAFEEQSISLLVGDTYSPSIKVLPRYAANKSYRLISSDSTALSVEGGTITALKPSTDVKLKVVSSENANINDVISVTIYAEPINLIAPTGLVFDGEFFSFVDLNDSNVSSYELLINDQKINIGNNTKYSFDSVVEKLGEDLYNKQLTCSVKAIGDNKIFVDSEAGEQIEFIKFSTIVNPKVEDGVVLFDAIENASGYQITINYKGLEYKYTTTSAEFEIPQYGEINNNGQKDTNEVDFGVGEYDIQILPTTQPGMYNSAPATLKYVVLGEVSNLNINGGMISWDFVRNAEAYDVQWCKGANVFKEEINFTENYIKVPEGLDAGEYVFKIKAKSSAGNTLQGGEKSIEFKILSTPIVSATNNVVRWDSVDGAEGYLVTITKDSVATGVNNKFVINNTYDVSAFLAGNYTIEVVANGNGSTIMSSIKSTPTNWKVLSNTTLSVANSVVLWEDVGASSYDFVCNANSDGSEIVNTVLSTTAYDLSTYDLDSGDYTITVHPRGTGANFDAKASSTQITKLENASIEGLASKKFAVNKVDKGVKYKIEIDKPADSNFETITLENIVDGNKFVLDDNVLSAGEYIAKVFVYGNGKNIFDANNDSVTYSFKKLDTPTIDYEKTADSSGSTIIKIVIGEVVDAEGYKLMQNGTKVVNYDISNLSAGDYSYTAQSLGNNANILDSDITKAEDEIRVKKLAIPTIEFDKTTLKYTVNTKEEDKQCINNYNFTINGTELAGITTTNNEVDCSAHITQAILYSATVYAVARADNQDLKTETGFDLVIDSNIGKFDGVKKIAGACTFKIEHSSERALNLIVEPAEKDALTESTYMLSLVLYKLDSEGNPAQEGIELNNFTYSASTKSFTMNLYKNTGKYEVIDVLEALLAADNEHKLDSYAISAVISHSSPKIVSSDKYLLQTNLKVLDKVKNISKNGQTIEFDVVEGATNYVAVVTLGGEDIYVNLKDKYTEKTTGTPKNVLKASDLVELLGAGKYKEETLYQVKFIALSDDETTITNKGNDTYSFAFLKKPDLDIVEIEGHGNAKFATIENNNDKVSQYDVTISYLDGDETKIVKQGLYTKQAGNVYEAIKLDDLEGYVNITGVVTIKAIAIASTGEYFNSVNATTTATKLDVPEVEIVNGKLQWSVVPNAKQYNLTYSNSTQIYPLVLTPGVQNFSILDGKCIYDCDMFPSGNTNIKLQVDALISNGHYINSNTSADKAAYKLSTLPINVGAGEIATKISIWSDLIKVSRAEVLVDGVNFNVNISDYKEESGEQEGVDYSFDLQYVYMTLNPTAALKYKNMEYEEITIKLYSGNSSTLNSSVARKSLRGLLSPINLDILTTSTTDTNTGAVTEVVEKIIWANQSANAAHVGKYEVVVNYEGLDHSYQTTSTQLDMPNFGVGTYKIKVRALAKTDGNNDVVNSRYCEEIVVTILSAPTGLTTKDGNVAWENSGAEYYLTRVYLINSATSKTLISSKAINGIEIDLTSTEFRQAGVYGITVQSMSNDANVLSSVESEMLQIVRLPEVTEYFVDDGELYVRVHKFYTKMELVLTGINDPLTIINEDLSAYTEFVGSNDWLDTAVVDTFSDDDYYIDVKYQNEGSGTLSTLLAEGYAIQVKLYGNSATKGAIVSNQIAAAYNSNLTITGGQDVFVNEIEKLPTPITEISPTVHGQVLLSIPEGSIYPMKYFKTDTGNDVLEGVHLYSVEIHIGNGKELDNKYTLFVADIVVDLKSFKKEIVEENGLKYFKHDNKVFNVIDKIVVYDKTYIPFDFNAGEYAYYAANSSGEAIYNVLNLGEGGLFTLSARFEGDDSKYVQSEVSKEAIIKRYKVLNLTAGGGDVSWENLTTQVMVGEETKTEAPIYIIVANDNSTNETYHFALYNEEIHNEDEVRACLDNNATYILVPITYDIEAENIIFDGLAKAIYDARINSGDDTIKALAGKGGVFAISIKAHHIIGTATDVLPAQSAVPSSFTILPATTINLSEGALTWALSYITTSNNYKTYLYNYLLKVYKTNESTDELEFITQTILKSTMYTESNNIATYVPGLIEGVQLEVGTKYSFEICTMPAGGENYLKSMTTSLNNLQIHDQVVGVRLEEQSGEQKLVWEDTINVQILISYNLDGVIITSKPISLSSTNTYTLPSSFTDTSGNSREVVPGHTYHFQIRRQGDNSNYISGAYRDACQIQQLSTISVDSVITNGGVLTWEKATLDGEVQSGTSYTLTYIYGGVRETVSEIQDNFFSFDGICAAGGEIDVRIVAKHHNAEIKQSKTTKKIVYKLKCPTFSSIVGQVDATYVTWDKVLDGDGREVDNYIVLINGRDEYKCSTNRWDIVNVTGTRFTIQIRAISEIEGGKQLNGEYGAAKTINMPSAVTEVLYDDETKSFKWNATEDIKEGDEYYIYYRFNNEEELTETLVTSNENGEYVYKPIVVGVYTNIYVQIKRVESLRSLITSYSKTYTHDLFESGDGVDNPYVITTENHLMNIKYFLNSRYILQETITLTSNQQITNASQVFTGELDGNSQYNIVGYDENVITRSTALFEKAENAIFKNLNLSQFKIENTYNRNSEVKLGILVNDAVNTSFKSISVTQSSISVTAEVEACEMYIGGIAGYVTEGSFEACYVKLGEFNDNAVVLEVKGNSETALCFGAIAGALDNSSVNMDGIYAEYYISTYLQSITNNDIDYPAEYIGALAGVTSNLTSFENAEKLIYCGYFVYDINSEYTEQTNIIGREI